LHKPKLLLCLSTKKQAILCLSAIECIPNYLFVDCSYIGVFLNKLPSFFTFFEMDVYPAAMITMAFNVLLCTLCRYALFACFTLTTAINEWSSMLYSIIYTSLPTIVVAIFDKDLSRRNLLQYPQLYGAGQRQEAYDRKLFWLTMSDTLWQSVVVFFVPLFAYWASTIDVPSIGDLWTLAVVILVNLHLAMDIIRWNWIFHAVIWGSIVATFICVMILDAFPMFAGYWYALLSFTDVDISCIYSLVMFTKKAMYIWTD